MTREPPVPGEVDPFDLPEALGAGEVTWTASDGIHARARVRGALSVSGPAVPDLACDLLAVDDAYPVPVAGDALRATAHQAWRHGQVHLASYDDRLTILVPGSTFSAELVLEAIARLARAVGAEPSSYVVRLRLGA